MRRFSAIVILSLSVYLFNSNALTAKVTCTGTACSSIPSNYLNEFDQLDYSIQSQYLNPVMDSMIKATGLSNSNIGSIGPGYVNRFQLGVGVSAGYVKGDDITVQHKDIKLPKLPNVGADVAPYVMGAVNLGWLLGKGAYEKNENRNFFHRFNIYVHGLHKKMGYNKEKKDSIIEGEIHSKNFGGMIRFQIINEMSTKFNILGFTGVNIGAGYNYQEFNINATNTEKKAPKMSFGTVSGSWKGITTMEYNSKMATIPVDVRTGVRLFYFFTIFGGAGVSFNNGSANFYLNRTGPFDITVNPTDILNNLGNYASYLNNSGIDISKPISQQATLSMDIKSYSKTKQRMEYYIAGMEINLWYVKIVGEGILYKDKNYGANVGVKFDF